MAKYIEDIKILAQENRITVHDAAVKIVLGLSDDEKNAILIDRFTKQAAKGLRDIARDSTTNPDQLILFEMERSAPRLVRVELEPGEELFLHPQDATIDQIKAHYVWAINEARKNLGILERGARHWHEIEGHPTDVPLGEIIYKDELCDICGLGYLPGNPMEDAHLKPVGLGLGDQETRKAHRSCNRSEGTGR